MRTEVIKDQEIEKEYKDDNTLDKGIEKVVQEGKLGEVEVTYEDIYYKGIFDRTQEVSRKVLVESEPKIINIGIPQLMYAPSVDVAGFFGVVAAFNIVDAINVLF